MAEEVTAEAEMKIPQNEIDSFRLQFKNSFIDEHSAQK